MKITIYNYLCNRNKKCYSILLMYLTKYLKYKLKNKMIGGYIDIYALSGKEYDDGNPETLKFYEGNFTLTKILGSGSYGIVNLYCDNNGNQIVAKKYKNNKYANIERNIYNFLKEKSLLHLFPKSIFTDLLDGSIDNNDIDIDNIDNDIKTYLIMEKLNEINIQYIILNYKNLISFLSQITNHILTLIKNKLYFTDLKINNIMQYEDDKYVLIDFGAICFEPDFNCQITYSNNILKTHSLNKLNEFNKSTNFNYYLSFLIWLLIVQLFDINCAYIYHPNNYQKEYSCNNILLPIIKLINNSNLSDSEKTTNINFFEKIIKKNFIDNTQINEISIEDMSNFFKNNLDTLKKRKYLI